MLQLVEIVAYGIIYWEFFIGFIIPIILLACTTTISIISADS